ncbi:amino acid transporter [Stipitochalara longipes BDJ]|nr:amino acid transporter [Stipitochalara longipes BDJ]
MHSHTPEETTAISDDLVLESLGYKPELKRSFSLFGMIGFAFSVLTCWTALAGSLVVGINSGGPPVIIWSWVGVSVCSMAVAYSFAEICSAFPVAGGQYSWVAILAPPRYARPLSYCCGWFILIGFLSAGAGNGFVGANFVLGMAQMANPDYTIERWHTCLMAYLLLILAAATNIWGRKALEKLSQVMIIFNIVSFVVVIVVILARDNQKNNASFVFKDFQNFTGFGTAYASLLGLLQSAFGMTGYDATAHMTEEMKDARKDAPKAIIWAVWIGAITGFIFLVAVCFCIVDIDAAASTPTGVPIFEIFESATRSFAAGMVLSVQISIISLVSLAFLCAQSSRLAFAFARDGGLPFSKFFSKVDAKSQVPINAICLVVAINMALMSIYFGSVTGFNTILAISTEGFYLSYIMPLAVRLWGRWTGKGPEFIEGSYNLKFGVWLNILGVLYLAFATITFNFPSTYPINASNMNYTCAAVGVSVLIAAVTWFTTGSKHFSGPQAGSMLQGHAIHAHHVPQSVDGSLETHIMDHKTMDPVVYNKAHSE